MPDNFLILGSVALVAVVVAVGNWRRAVLLAMLLIIFEGALRKWLLPEAQAALYFAKDVILLGGYVGFAVSKEWYLKTKETRVLWALGWLAACYGAVQIFNPDNPSFLLGLIGWKSYFFYVPLAFIVPHLFRSEAEIHSAARKYLLIAIPVAALGFVQFASPADSVLNSNVSHGDRLASYLVFGERGINVRASGTFSFISGYTEFLTTIGLLAIGLLTGSKWRIHGNYIAFVAFVASVAAMFTTGSRGPIFSLVLVSPLFLWLSVRNNTLSFAMAVRTGIILAVTTIAVVYAFPEPIEAFAHRTRAADDSLDRITSTLIEPIEVFLYPEGTLGFGTGTAHNSAQYLTGAAHRWWLRGLRVEGEPARVMAELGLVGFILIFAIRVWLCIVAARYAVAFRSPMFRGIAAASACFFVLHVVGFVAHNPTANLYYWFIVGLLFAMSRLDPMVEKPVRMTATPLTDLAPRPQQSSARSSGD